MLVKRTEEGQEPSVWLQAVLLTSCSIQDVMEEKGVRRGDKRCRISGGLTWSHGLTIAHIRYLWNSSYCMAWMRCNWGRIINLDGWRYSWKKKRKASTDDNSHCCFLTVLTTAFTKFSSESAVPEEIGSSCSRWIMQILKFIIRNYSVPAVLCCMSIASVQSIGRARRAYSVRKKWEQLTEGCEIAFIIALFSRHGVIQNTVHFLIPDRSIWICMWQVFPCEANRKARQC